MDDSWIPEMPTEARAKVVARLIELYGVGAEEAAEVAEEAWRSCLTSFSPTPDMTSSILALEREAHRDPETGASDIATYRAAAAERAMGLVNLARGFRQPG